MDEDYAIVIGIDRYPNLPALSSSLNDAVAFAEWLSRPKPAGGGITDSTRLRILLSPDGDASAAAAVPVAGEIKSALESFGVGRKKLIGRRLYIYFSGHGVGINSDNVAMLMADASLNSFVSNLGMALYRQFFELRDLFEEVVFIADCCRDQVVRQTISQMPPDFTIAAAVPPPPVVNWIMMAATHGEKAFAVPKSSGLLTRAVLEGLAGEAADQDGLVTSNLLADYASKRVGELAAGLGTVQSPRSLIFPDSGKKIKLCRVDQKVRVKIFVGPNPGGFLQITKQTGTGAGRRVAKLDLSTIGPGQPLEIDLNYSRLPYDLELLETGDIDTLLLSEIKRNNYEFHFTAGQ